MSVESSHEAQVDRFDKFDADHEAAVALIRKVRHDAKIAARRTSKSSARHSGMPPPRSDHGMPNYFTVRELAVRFRVSRNAKTSTITREGLPAPEGPETAETEES